jgi:hypothetical protein
MTAAKSLQRKEVDKIAAALLGALKPEYPGTDDIAFDFPPVLRRPTSKRGAALWEAYKLAWAASVRFARRQQKGRAKKRGQGAAFFDDQHTRLAISSLERARTLVRNARAALERDIAAIGGERARHGMRGDDVGEHRDHVRALEQIAKALEMRISRLKTFEGIPQARTKSEWDAFLSETARKLLDAGFGTREVAALLSGKKPEAVDRATLERFRQRVSRLEISAG